MIIKNAVNHFLTGDIIINKKKREIKLNERKQKVKQKTIKKGEIKMKTFSCECIIKRMK